MSRRDWTETVLDLPWDMKPFWKEGRVEDNEVGSSKLEGEASVA